MDNDFGGTSTVSIRFAGPFGLEGKALSPRQPMRSSLWQSLDCGAQVLALPFGGSPIPSTGLSIKRVMDLVLSVVGLAVLWPLLLAIALAVKLESPGSAFYCSLRVGKHGRTFPCYKFRTMIRGADKLKKNLRSRNQRSGPFFKIADDPRVTRLGRFLRKYSLDELPQLWNVLKGEMSLVGPRPHPIEDCAQYTSRDCRRLGVTPGMTGLWQVSGRRDPSFETSITLDMTYIEKWSLLLDFVILFQTIPAVLAGEGQ